MITSSIISGAFIYVLTADSITRQLEPFMTAADIVARHKLANVLTVTRTL